MQVEEIKLLIFKNISQFITDVFEVNSMTQHIEMAHTNVAISNKLNIKSCNSC